MVLVARGRAGRQAPGGLRRRDEPGATRSTDAARPTSAPSCRTTWCRRHFVPLDALPLTANGKVDRKRAARAGARPRGAAEAATSRRAPPTEETLAGIWAAVLGVDRASASTTTSSSSAATPSSASRSSPGAARQGLHSRRATWPSTRPSPQLAEVVAPAGAVDAPEPEARGRRVAPTPDPALVLRAAARDPHHWNQAFLFEVPADVDVDAARAGARPRRRSPRRASRCAWRRTARLALTARPERARRRRSRASTCPAARRANAARHRGGRRDGAGGARPERGPLVAAVHFDSATAPGRLCSRSTTSPWTASPGGSCSRISSWRTGRSRPARRGLPRRIDLLPALVRGAPGYARRPSQAIAATLGGDRRASTATLPRDARRGPARTRRRRPGRSTSRWSATRPEALLQRVPAAYRTQINDVLLAALGAGAPRLDGPRRPSDRPGGTRTRGMDRGRRPIAHGRLVHDALSRSRSISTAPRTRARRSKRMKEAAAPGSRSRAQLRRCCATRRTTGGRAPARAAAGRAVFNYLGQFDQVVAGSKLFGFAHEPSGRWHGPANERTHRLEVVAARARRPLRGALDATAPSATGRRPSSASPTTS